MTAVASSQMPEGLRGLDEQFSEPGVSSRFTAVNGRGSPSAAERTEPTNGNGHDDQRNGVSNGHTSPERVHDVITVQQTVPPASKATQEQNSPVVREQPAPYSAPPARSVSRSPPSRKRSFPEAFGDSNGNHLPQAHHRTHTEASDYIRGLPGPYSHAASRLPPSHEIDPTRQQPPLSSDFDPHAHTRQPYYTQPPRDESEVRLAEALQRENGNGSLNRETFASPEEEDQHRQQYGDYSGSRQPMSDAERKRRKRVFSNRTKTGCMTCRKRKKKCDELHPECNNCLRGGFVCEGYTARNAWQKPTPTKQPIPLQSKNGYGTSKPHDSGVHYNDSGVHYTEVSPEYGATSRMSGPLQNNGSEHKPIMVDEEQREISQLASPPADPRNQNNWPRDSRQYSSHQPRYQEMDRSPAVHDMSHEVPDQVNPYHTTPPHPSHAAQPSRTTTSSSQSAPAVAQAALQNPILTQRPAPHFRVELTEREKMLRGEYYLPYTPALMADREQCAAAVWRFNNSTNPTNGNSPEERLRFFKAILSLRPSAEPLPPTAEGRDQDPAYLPVGSVGPGVVVEAPFHCDYGYNINIGSNVIIGPDCRITDTCAVTIGNNVVFSPGVKLVCATYGIDPRERRKGKGRALGRNIIIEDDSWIGSNVTILPGVRVGRSSTVGAGSLICKDVPPYTVVAGNPQKVVRGIYDGN
ncbi:Maltose acetyltransferase [Xylographa carneopallida]|nr:Maltose acetyltransferase [Xylographa carneopallida]